MAIILFPKSIAARQPRRISLVIGACDALPKMLLISPSFPVSARFLLSRRRNLYPSPPSNHLEDLTIKAVQDFHYHGFMLAALVMAHELIANVPTLVYICMRICVSLHQSLLPKVGDGPVLQRDARLITPRDRHDT